MFFIFEKSSVSDFLARAFVASSRIIISEFLYKARAIAIFCLWPPLRFFALSNITNSSLPFFWLMKFLVPDKERANL